MWGLLLFIAGITNPASAYDYFDYMAGNAWRSDISGYYWSHTTDSGGNLVVTVVAVNSYGNIVDESEFDAAGQALSGSSRDGSESLADRIAEEGEASDSGWLWAGDDPLVSPALGTIFPYMGYICFGLECQSGGSTFGP